MNKKSKVAGLIIVAAATALPIVPLLAQSTAHPVPTVDVHALEKMKGPKVPANATKLGKQEQPMAGDLKMPIQNVDVYQFPRTNAERARGTDKLGIRARPGDLPLGNRTHPVHRGDGRSQRQLCDADQGRR